LVPWEELSKGGGAKTKSKKQKKKKKVNLNNSLLGRGGLGRGGAKTG